VTTIGGVRRGGYKDGISRNLGAGGQETRDSNQYDHGTSASGTTRSYCLIAVLVVTTPVFE
jgi:hypothetical protein